MKVSIVSGCIFVCYLIGAIPTGFIIARLAGVSDIRAHGSGNIGATNVARILGSQFFPLVFLIDAAKAYVPLMVAASADMAIAPLCLMAGALLIGNVYSIFLSGSGGKGVATAVGVMAALSPTSLIPVISVFLATVMLTKTVGIASIAAAGVLPGFLWYLRAAEPIQMLGIFLAALIMWRHKDNIKRYFSAAVS